ncbi:GNAT family N-acetyltransferase [Desulfovibrio sp. OttesenSCG-928-O18]|nr:GNAT family N-acetyltransferase [Desulfovibrio sp. OttesenSCG-928-O18]
MLKQKVRERLALKDVGLEHIDQFNQLLRYVFQVTNEELFKSGYEAGELIRSKRPMLERADVFGWFDGSSLISQLCVYPCEVNIHGRVFAMGGLTGVGTYPEYAGMGLMNDLLRLGLGRMRARGQYISYLFPYSIPFYRHRGWEILSDKISFTIKDHQLPKQVEVPGFVERLAIDHADVFRTYDRFARVTHGALIRSKLDWEEYWRWENEDERTAAVYYTEDHDPTGLLIYWIEDDIFHIKEMVYLNQEARRGLWNFISAHFSMIDEVRGETFKNEPLAFYLEDSQIVETIEPYFMARVVDVRAFLEQFPFVDFYETFHFVVSDPVAEWNNGVFSVTGMKNGKNLVGAEAVGRGITLDVQTLTSMLMNYRRPSYFADLEHLAAEQDAITLLENIIPSRQPYFSDYF